MMLMLAPSGVLKYNARYYKGIGFYGAVLSLVGLLPYSLFWPIQGEAFPKGVPFSGCRYNNKVSLYLNWPFSKRAGDWVRIFKID